MSANKGDIHKSKYYNFYANQKEPIKTIDVSKFIEVSNRLEYNINLLLKLLK